MTASTDSPAPPRRRSWPPWLIAVSLGLLALLAAFVPTVWHMATRPPGGPGPTGAADAPWAIVADGRGGVQVFGLAMPGSTLTMARQRWAEGLQVAVMADRGQSPTLEAYVERFSAGGVDGRLVLAFDAPEADLTGWQASSHGEPLPGGGWRHPLPPGVGEAAPLRGLSFMPAAQLDAALLRQRFGEPAEVIAVDERLSHWLYPELGLAVALDAEGRELLQVVAPADFDRLLRQPLQMPRAASVPGN